MRVFSLAMAALISFSAQANLPLTNFDLRGMNAWEKKSFVGNTEYVLIKDDGRTVLRAESNAAASALILKRKIDLKSTPYLNWSWRVTDTLPPLDERSKGGDDYAARIYLVIDGGMMFWNTLSLSYVWSGSQEMGSQWDNAYAGENLQMLAVRGPQDEQGQWHYEKRNVYQDLIATLGDMGSDDKNERRYRYIDAVAIMTDSDDSKDNAVAYYGDIVFSAD